MRPCGCARKPTDARMSSRTHPHTYTYTHPCTPMYARIRAREGNFLTTNLLYSIAKPTSIISPTPFTSIIQSLYNPYPYWHHIGCAICTNCQHLPLIYHSFTTNLLSIINHLPTIHHLSFISHLSSIHYHRFPSSLTYLPFIITVSHHLAHVIFHLYPISRPTNSPSYQYVSLL